MKEKIQHYMLELATLKLLCEEITSMWNGEDEQGEDMAHIADDIIEKIKELEELLQELAN